MLDGGFNFSNKFCQKINLTEADATLKTPMHSLFPCKEFNMAWSNLDWMIARTASNFIYKIFEVS